MTSNSKRVHVVYVANGTTHNDFYECEEVSSTVSRVQGVGVLNLRLTDGLDEKGPIRWVTYLSAVKVECRPPVEEPT